MLWNNDDQDPGQYAQPIYPSDTEEHKIVLWDSDPEEPPEVVLSDPELKFLESRVSRRSRLARPFEFSTLARPFEFSTLARPFEFSALTRPFEFSTLACPFKFSALTRPFSPPFARPFWALFAGRSHCPAA
jgi:hypothetical protein